MTKSLLIYFHLLASVSVVGLGLWLLHDLWAVVFAISLGIALAIVLRRRKRG